ncbi:4-(cytidine 5'-diphospho)-2-C-methyl-D-erythritol kinase [Aerococcus sanguinicola]|uniref:4-diphosphocytidyl-2-C-methyl-D-erythritol kinase n=1 Tax=Aerococcus sanguinicola TaxID=119206 RepID=A0A109RDB1_9LACT|nr:MULTISPECIES: 4-(cytidine 5'-diphospho)-2-C-methyl-D-erythritol kinase [Aerococcus]AMB93741.1 hypothetical protein AWM72_02730 [Aerococcus sanguinicola]MDK7050410.1 4-(cytidine 5'-diphospho)-2-C-methyl-D-erythritol kinase [Aerococcus sanguinicola]OFT94793.1 hypothetical protein HMPREF3090_05410 [Aerococcus sp. HMSC23C02]PKZ21530.1 4-(cytidine 5'-diphospho)-2-C-methyl-D-erythritol kinase [Aerococcus sanguinicola]
MSIIEKAAAKINLSQDLIYQADKGQWHYDMVMASVDLSDRLTIQERSDQEIVVRTSRSFLPNDARNHAYRAADLIKEASQVDRGLDIIIEKRIPVSAGLGGGSSDAAAVLRAVNKLWDLHYSTDELLQLALQIDADAPYCLLGGIQHVTGQGDQLQALPALPASWLVLAKPPLSVSTDKILQDLDPNDLPDQGNTPAVLQAIHKQSYQDLVQATGNMLEDLVFWNYPILNKLKAKMQKFGAEGVTMTGTGSTVIGFAPTSNRAKHVYNALRGFCKEVYVVPVLQQGTGL